jgi:hypothetical protein
MHGIDGQQSLLEPQLAQQSLDRRDFVRLFIAVEMRQYQGRARCKRAENMLSPSTPFSTTFATRPVGQ